MLDRGALHFRAYPCEQSLTVVTRIAEYANLDQFVLQQCEIDFVQDCRGQAMLANRNDRLQVVRFRAQFAASCRCKRAHLPSL
jgi:hypothetical protein